MDPIAIALFFYITYIAIIDYLIASDRYDGHLRSIYHHYSIVKINNCNILYLHYILWINRNFDLADIRTWLYEDEFYAFWMITYLDIIISYYIVNAIL